ncbi:T-cell immunoglobulin and mucin domain-containing protein 4-like isoform X2 [Chelmon rostratus]|uniref:T-cell immunoglobulin and mucin domain-containing protein 4-like isoform X2 n=1 Tax=Chelmon rostratus TaxID=109905 RepID=UPI001BE76F22|nr:T-cell immunoglobulin and mucin domain-containing protein 4-like isoform X2 [Chelmon rostratus]
MTLRHFDFIMKVAVLLALLAVSECSSSSVVGQTGQNVTLPCKYDIKKYSQLSVCWGRGEIPASGCNNLLVSTDRQKVKGRDSSRYQLLGRLDKGDVSLTILNVTASDAGRYGCRLEIPGWFNDDKHHFQLIVEEAAQTTTRAGNRETSTEQPAADPTTGQLTSTETLLTSSSSSIKLEENSSATLVLVFVLFGVVALVTVGGFFIIGRTWRRFRVPQQQIGSSARFSSTASTLQLHSRGSAVENIYQIDGGGDGGEYEFCP